MDHYNETSPLQKARLTSADFQKVLQDLGSTVLPSVVKVMQDVDSTLKWLGKLLPGGNDPAKGIDKWAVGARVLEGIGGGAFAGALLGAAGGPVGALGGAVIGGVVGGVGGVAEQYMANNKGSVIESLIALEHEAKAEARAKRDGKSAVNVSVSPQTLNVMLDAKAIGQAVTSSWSVFGNQAAGFDGLGIPPHGDAQHSDK